MAYGPSRSLLGYDQAQQVLKTAQLVWDTNTLAWVNSTASSGSGPEVSVSNFPATQAVTGTFWQTTQPISIATMPTTPVTGSLTDAGSGKILKSVPFSISSTATVISAVPGKRIKVYATKLSVTAAIAVNFRDGASTALEGALTLGINGGYTESVDPPNFLFATTAGNSLDLVITGVGTAAGRISYWDDDAA